MTIFSNQTCSEPVEPDSLKPNPPPYGGGAVVILPNVPICLSKSWILDFFTPCKVEQEIGIKSGESSRIRITSGRLDRWLEAVSRHPSLTQCRGHRLNRLNWQPS